MGSCATTPSESFNGKSQYPGAGSLSQEQQGGQHKAPVIDNKLLSPAQQSTTALEDCLAGRHGDLHVLHDLRISGHQFGPEGQSTRSDPHSNAAGGRLPSMGLEPRSAGGELYPTSQGTNLSREVHPVGPPHDTRTSMTDLGRSKIASLNVPPQNRPK